MDRDERIIVKGARLIEELREEIASLNTMRDVIEARRRDRTLTEALDAIDDEMASDSPYTAEHINGMRAARMLVRALFSRPMPSV